MKEQEKPRVIIKELRLRNFRAFENARFVLDDKLTVVVGGNGSGKSTLMEAFDFLRDALTNGLATAWERRGGPTGICRRINAHGNDSFDDECSDSVSLGIVLSVQGQEVLYEFELARIKYEYEFVVKREAFVTQRGDHSFKRNGEHFNTEVKGIAPASTSNALLLPIIASQDKLWYETFEALSRIRVYSFSVAAIRSEPELNGSTVLNKDGGNIIDAFRWLERRRHNFNSYQGETEWIVEYLAEIAPGITGIHTAEIYNHWFILVSQHSDSTTYNFSLKELSDGTLRSLAILLALRQKPTPTLVFIDEIEDSIHPGALAALLEAVDEATEWCQVVITSHSPGILRRKPITGQRVRVTEWNEGKSEIYQLRKEVIDSINPPDVSVGELLEINALWTEDEPMTIPDGKFFEVSA